MSGKVKHTDAVATPSGAPRDNASLAQRIRNRRHSLSSAEKLRLAHELNAAHGLDDRGRKKLLVISSISRRSQLPSLDSYGLTLFKKSLRQTVKGNVNTDSLPKTHKRAKIKAFSYKSRQRLKLTCEQGGYKVKSQFCMTYHNDWPTDGKVLKRHLDNFLRALRRKFSGVDYVWVVEVQRRGAPHYHLCLPFDHEDRQIHTWLAETWNRIAAPDDLNHLAVHLHAKSFYAWDMENSSYLTKYLGKEGQKEIPEHFENFGRFWGCSTTFADAPDASSWKDIGQPLSYTATDLATGEDQSFDAPMWLRRQLAKYHRAQLRQYGKRSKLSGKVHRQSFTLTNGRLILDQLTAYLERQSPPESPPPF